MGFLLYNEYVIDQFKQQERDRAELYANLYGLASSYDLPEQYHTPIAEKVVLNDDLQFPIIVTDHRGEILNVKGQGLPDAADSSAAVAADLRRIVKEMDAAHQPVRFFESSQVRGLVYFDGRDLVIVDMAADPVVWLGPNLPAMEDTTAVARARVRARLEDLRSATPDSVTLAAEGYSHVYTMAGGFIVVDAGGSVVAWGGDQLPRGKTAAAFAAVQSAAESLAADTQPSSFRIATEKYVHFGQSEMIGQIYLAPLVTIGVLILFSLIGYIGFRNIRRSEQRSIWVGMAKETAHQLGTPLSSLSGWLELIENRHGEEELPSRKVDSIVSEMQKDMRRLTQIASRFSQIGSVPELHPADVRAVLAETVSYFKGRGPQFGRHSFEVDFQDVPAVPLNTELMGWAFENLFKNAMDAIGTKQGTIAVRVAPRDDMADWVRITLSDNGRGIGADNLSRVFDPGFSTKKRGWGLGLAFVKRIVEDYHSGRIQIAHSAEGEGSTFELDLPAWRPT